MDNSPPSPQIACSRCGGQRVCAEVMDAYIRRMGGKPVVGFSVIVCLSCGLSEFFVAPSEMPKLIEAIEKYPDSFKL